MKAFLKAALALVAAQSLHAAVLIDLDASALSGAVSAWSNQGSVPGALTSAAPVRVEKVQDRAALIFDGKQQFASGFTLPAGFEKGAFTVEAWVLNPSIAKAETVLSFTRTNGGPGTEFSFASGPTAGAFRSGFKATTPFTLLPAVNEWQHLAWTYSPDGVRVYVNGELDSHKPLRFTMATPLQVRVGAAGEIQRQGARSGFSGAVSRVRVHDIALTQTQLREGAELRNAFGANPRPQSVTDALSTKLSWQPGSRDVASYVIYFSTNRAAVERGETSVATTTTSTVTKTLSLTLGAQHFWRVEQRTADGRVITSGVVWSFTADPGLASAPQPRMQDGNVPVSTAQLTWRPGKYATRQRLFLSTNANEFGQALAELTGTAAQHALPALNPGTRYFWRVDSDNGAQPPARGETWTFRTQDTPVPKDVTFFVSSDTHYGRENNAAINRRVIDEMNALPGTPLPASVGGGFVRTPLGVVLNGDLLDEGFDKVAAPALWAEFCRDYGLNGRDGQLSFPAYEGFGNHDGGPTRSVVRPGVKERNRGRVGLKAVSENGLHYSWDWDHVHLVQLNLFGGSGPADVKGVNGVEHDPEKAIEFLREDLAKHVGQSGRPVIVFQHFGWTGGMSEWWQPEAKERFYEAVKPYNVACLINGHSHGASFIPWKDLLTIHDGATARGESDNGDFMVVRVTDKELIVIQRKLGEWGIYKRQPLVSASEREPAGVQ